MHFALVKNKVREDTQKSEFFLVVRQTNHYKQKKNSSSKDFFFEKNKKQNKMVYLPKYTKESYPTPKLYQSHIVLIFGMHSITRD